MNEEESYDELILEQHVVDADDLVEAEAEPYVDDYQPSEEVIYLDMMQEDDLLEVA